MKQVAGKIKLELAQYREMAAFSQFASDLDVSTQKLLARGARLTELLKQAQYSPLSVAEQSVSIFAGVRGYLDSVPIKDINTFEKDYLRALRSQQPQLLKVIDQTGTITAEQEKLLEAFLTSFCANFAVKN